MSVHLILIIDAKGKGQGRAPLAGGPTTQRKPLATAACRDSPSVRKWSGKNAKEAGSPGTQTNRDDSEGGPDAES